MDVGGFLMMGLGAGLLHALDPDHVAAVGGMRSVARGSTPELPLALHWALGHSAAIFVIALLVLVAGVVMPPQMEAAALSLVAVSLIVVGLMGLRSARRATPPARWNTRAGVIGLLHGGAGSAPLLALIPVSLSTQLEWALVHVLLFNLGVVFAMLGIGFALRATLTTLGRPGHAIGIWSQSALALASLLLGCHLLINGPLLGAG